MRTYLVTGGAGFIGSNYIHYMFKKYDNEIRIINVDVLTYAGNLENLKDIENRDNYTFVKNIQVDENNKYYASKDGVLYTKDMKSLLFDAKLGWYYCTESSYSVPDFVENFEPSNGIAENLGSIVFEKSIKKINTFIDKGENGVEPDPEYRLNVVVKGYKNTVAEKWAEKQYAKFKALD